MRANFYSGKIIITIFEAATQKDNIVDKEKRFRVLT